MWRDLEGLCDKSDFLEACIKHQISHPAWAGFRFAQHRTSDISCLVVQGYPPSLTSFAKASAVRGFGGHRKKAGRFQPAGDQMNGYIWGVVCV